MTYEEAKDQLKFGDYWLVHWENEYIIGFIGYKGLRNGLEKQSLGMYFSGSNTGYYLENIEQYIRKIDIPELVNDIR